MGNVVDRRSIEEIEGNRPLTALIAVMGEWHDAHPGDYLSGVSISDQGYRYYPDDPRQVYDAHSRAWTHLGLIEAREQSGRTMDAFRLTPKGIDVWNAMKARAQARQAREAVRVPAARPLDPVVDQSEHLDEIDQTPRQRQPQQPTRRKSKVEKAAARIGKVLEVPTVTKRSKPPAASKKAKSAPVPAPAGVQIRRGKRVG